MSGPRYSAESDALFAAIFELPTAERAQAIDSACDGRPDLRRDVESLLAAHDSAKDFLRPLARPASRSPVQEIEVEEDLTGTRIGSFTVTGRLGRGGMSDVYRAERSDGTFEQAVAIKVARVPLTITSRTSPATSPTLIWFAVPISINRLSCFDTPSSINSRSTPITPVVPSRNRTLFPCSVFAIR